LSRPTGHTWLYTGDAPIAQAKKERVTGKAVHSLSTSPYNLMTMLEQAIAIVAPGFGKIKITIQA
jgi:hypothetical protein